jgi:AcrR family transcriptional regulator
MPRLSRADSQARTREQLLATAKALFLRDGYFATSLERVADAAGYSKGAVYSNFGSKDELCLAVLDEIRLEQAGQIVAALQAAGDLDARLAAFERWAETAIGDEGWSNLELEFGSTVRRDPALRAAYTSRGAVIRKAVADLLDGLVAEMRTPLPMPAAELATALVSLGIGLGLQRAIDHEIPVRVLTDLVRVLADPATAIRSAPAGRARS